MASYLYEGEGPGHHEKCSPNCQNGWTGNAALQQWAGRETGVDAPGMSSVTVGEIVGTAE